MDTVATMRHAMESAGVQAAEVDKVLLVGGSSRIPLVGQLIGAEIGRPVVVDAHPKHAIALGAALHAASAVGKRAAMAKEQPAEPSAVQLAEPPTGEQMANLPPTSIITPLKRPGHRARRVARATPPCQGPTVQVTPALLAQAAGG